MWSKAGGGAATAELDLTGITTDSGTIAFSLSGPGVFFGTMNGYRASSSSLSYVVLDGATCAVDRAVVSTGQNGYSSATCATLLAAGNHTARVYTDGSGLGAPWRLQALRL